MNEEMIIAENEDKTKKILVRNEGLYVIVLQQTLPNGRVSEKNLEYRFTPEEAEKCAEEIALFVRGLKL